MAREVKCPQCGRRGGWLDLPSGPFCSPRCKQLDLGAWLDEERRISSPLAPEYLEDMPEEPPAGRRFPNGLEE